MALLSRAVLLLRATSSCILLHQKRSPSKSAPDGAVADFGAVPKLVAGADGAGAASNNPKRSARRGRTLAKLVCVNPVHSYRQAGSTRTPRLTAQRTYLPLLLPPVLRRRQSPGAARALVSTYDLQPKTRTHVLCLLSCNQRRQSRFSSSRLASLRRDLIGAKLATSNESLDGPRQRRSDESEEGRYGSTHLW